eukprot:Plantae.Rhodophyta-Purpureofilum_apyrenoidigerum.ctg14018.p1 GENE.Plantae.Rhodophyta-Purpureofilum_apyrenoidigerum.ctg14018~~Plantae.Rhodophyta-Purpureofilum_apyrenoidigerum.ctg14018.p1  ORF type:complete len:373 (-),score=83.15 Plantae.Rhodophyta-Purpureofilum_apyrenoidigerum.ctg14018:106-1224(-)
MSNAMLWSYAYRLRSAARLGGVGTPGAVFPELMPKDAGRLYPAKIDRLVARCGFRPVFAAIEERMRGGAEVTRDELVAVMKYGTRDVVESLLKEVESRGGRDRIVLNIYLEKMGMADDKESWTKMQRILADMREQGFDPDEDTYTIVLEYLRRSNNESEMEKWKKDMFDKLDYVGGKPYVVLARMALVNHKHELVEDYFKELTRKRLKFSVPFLEVVIESKIASGDLDGALAMLQRVRKVNNGSLTEPLVLSLIEALLRSQRMGDAMKVYHLARVCGPEPSHEVYKLLLPAVEESGNTLLRKELLRAIYRDVFRHAKRVEQIRTEDYHKRLKAMLRHAGPRTAARNIRINDFEIPAYEEDEVIMEMFKTQVQ